MFPFQQRPPRSPQPAPPVDPDKVPGTDEQLEEIHTFRLGLERRHRTAFAVLDRMEVWLGQALDRHLCPIPAPIHESVGRKTWVCLCGQAWLNPPWYAAWYPISRDTFVAIGHGDPGDECQCDDCRRRRA